MKTYVGTWPPDVTPSVAPPQQNHIPDSDIPIALNQVYAPEVLCVDAEGSIIGSGDISAEMEGRSVLVYFKLDFAVGWSKKHARDFVFLNAKPLGVQLLPDAEQEECIDSFSSPPSSPSPAYEGVFI